MLDVGCGWCWHWRNISKIRPDIKIVALDFIEKIFSHGKIDDKTKLGTNNFYMMILII